MGLERNQRFLRRRHRDRRLLAPRRVEAERFLREVVPRAAEGARAASLANITEFADPTFPFEVAQVSQRSKQRRSLPNLGEALAVEASGFERQVAAGIDLAFVGG